MSRRVLVAAAAALVISVVALHSCGSANHTQSLPRAQSKGPAAVPNLPRTQPTRNGVPVGWSHDPQGARAAAVSAVALTGTIARAGFITRSDMIHVLASTGFAATLTQESASQLDDLLGDLPAAGIATASVLFRELPLTATVEHADDGTARVTVWSVLVIGADGKGAPRQLWRTVTIDLVWQLNDWRIDGWTATAGPTPALGTSAQIAMVDDLASVTSWQTAGGS